MKTLILIPARGGSKGIPRKNIKSLNNKPLIYYTIDLARQLLSDDDICVSTDDEEIIEVVEKYGLKVSFKRPDYLASDICGTYEVIMHALDYFKTQGVDYERLILLQTTSPFRIIEDVYRCIDLFESRRFEMVTTVKEASSNPYYDCFEADINGYLLPSKGDGSYHRRQDAPKVYEYNGAVYIMDVASLRCRHYNAFKAVGFVEMDDLRSIDLDTMLDWKYAELLINENLV